MKLTFERFLQIAVKINQSVAVITDNDGKYANKISKKYEEYVGNECIKIFADNRDNLNTLEPQFVDANKTDLKALCDVISINSNIYNTSEKISAYMLSNKTDWALKVFESDTYLIFPEYISNAVAWCDEK